MSELSFTIVTEPCHIAELSALAEGIFREYFPTYLTPDKLDHLVKHMLSREVLTREIADEGYEFYFADVDGKHVGYIGVVARKDYLFLSKLYMKKSERGKGYGRQEFEFVKRRARECGLSAVVLTVDRNNEPTIKKYKHMGFTIIDEVDNDVGDGYQMNDYVMQYRLAE